MNGNLERALKMTFGEVELELNVVYDKIKSALFLELQHPDWILLRDERRIIVEHVSGQALHETDDDDKRGVLLGLPIDDTIFPAGSVEGGEGEIAVL